MTDFETDHEDNIALIIQQKYLDNVKKSLTIFRKTKKQIILVYSDRCLQDNSSDHQQHFGLNVKLSIS